MSNRPDLESPPRGPQRNLDAAIRSTAFGALVAGGVCLYFGFVWSADAPLSASPEATQIWFLVDHIFAWWLRVLGVGFLAAAGLSSVGKRMGALVSAVAEAAFSLLMLAMIIDNVVGGFNASVIIFAVLLVVGLSAGRHSWSVFTGTGFASHEEQPDQGL
jgi:hypothetical protein